MQLEILSCLGYGPQSLNVYYFENFKNYDFAQKPK